MAGVEADRRGLSNILLDEEEAEDENGTFFEASLFVDKSYVLRSFSFNDISVPLYCLAAATTDYDLTGQIVWPGAAILADYLTAHPQEVAGKAVVEVGAGAGLAGLVCAHVGSSAVTLTDHNSEVLQVVQRNVHHHNLLFQQRASASCSPTLECAQLEWADQQHLDALLAAHPTGFDVIIGADICYQQCHVPPLFTCIKALLSARQQQAISSSQLRSSHHGPGHDLLHDAPQETSAIDARVCEEVASQHAKLPPSSFILAYVERHLSTTKVVWEAARDSGLHLEAIEGTERKTADGFYQARIYRATLPPMV
ncbi:unnamed protein product [Closterium sp. Naga37s-1]|nr:unnamed protein product [Closterium sp. Naga37s-1]